MRVIENNHEVTIMPLGDECYAEYTTLYKPSYPLSGVLTLIYKIDVDNKEELLVSNLTLHTIDGNFQREVMDFPNSDGYYKIVSYIFPTKESLLEVGLIDGADDIEHNDYWRHRDLGNLIKNETTEILAVDETSDSLLSCLVGIPNPSPVVKSFKYKWACFLNLEDVISLLTARENSLGYVYGTNIQVVEEYYFKYNNLYKCFISKASDLLNLYRGCGKNSGICSDNNCGSRISSLQTLIRDYIWMVLNAIKYAVEVEDYVTANNLLNCISTCNGICNDVNSTNNAKLNTKTGCGCS